DSIRRQTGFRSRYSNITKMIGSAKASAERQPDRENRAFSRFAPDVDGASVGGDDGLDEAEAQAETTLGAAAVAAKQPVPDAGILVGGDPGAGVAHLEHGRSILGPNGDVDAAAGRRVLDRVVDEICRNLFEPRAVARYCNALGSRLR